MGRLPKSLKDVAHMLKKYGFEVRHPTKQEVGEEMNAFGLRPLLKFIADVNSRALIESGVYGELNRRLREKGLMLGDNGDMGGRAVLFVEEAI